MTRTWCINILLALDSLYMMFIFFFSGDCIVFECSKSKSSYAYPFTLVFWDIGTKFGHLFFIRPTNDNLAFGNSLCPFQFTLEIRPNNLCLILDGYLKQSKLLQGKKSGLLVSGCQEWSPSTSQSHKVNTPQCLAVVKLGFKTIAIHALETKEA